MAAWWPEGDAWDSVWWGEVSTSGKGLGWAWKDAPGQVEGEEEHSGRREQHDLLEAQ